jgi:hypothetical protein
LTQNLCVLSEVVPSPQMETDIQTVNKGETKMTTAIKNGKTKKVEIDFLHIDLETCTRCKGTDANLSIALDSVAKVLEISGAEVTIRKTLVDSEQTALDLGFVSSPTIRVNGCDIALELRESSCASCGEACGCEGKIDCRVWVYQGQEYTAAPVGMIVDAILSAVYSQREEVPRLQENGKKAVPENLKLFFANKVAKLQSCCTPDEQAVCCDASEKETCCSLATQSQGKGCGCQ